MKWRGTEPQTFAMHNLSRNATESRFSSSISRVGINLLPSVLFRSPVFAYYLFQYSRNALPRQCRKLVTESSTRVHNTLPRARGRKSGRAIKQSTQAYSKQQRAHSAHSDTDGQRARRANTGAGAHTASSRTSRLSHTRSPRETSTQAVYVGWGAPMCEQARK